MQFVIDITVLNVVLLTLCLLMTVYPSCLSDWYFCNTCRSCVIYLSASILAFLSRCLHWSTCLYGRLTNLDLSWNRKRKYKRRIIWFALPFVSVCCEWTKDYLQRMNPLILWLVYIWAFCVTHTFTRNQLHNLRVCQQEQYNMHVTLASIFMLN